MEKGQFVAVRRDTGEKAFVPVGEAAEKLRALLEDMQSALFERALAFRRDNTFRAKTYADFLKLIDDPGGFIEAGWCGEPACEAKVEEETKATIRLLHLQEASMEGGACIVCAEKARHTAVFASAY